MPQGTVQNGEINLVCDMFFPLVLCILLWMCLASVNLTHFRWN